MQQLGIFLLSLAWLIPNISSPWISFWMETVAVTGLVFMSIATIKYKNISLDRRVIFLFLFFIAIQIFNLLLRPNAYYGDYFLGIFYFFCFFAAITIGQNNPDYFEKIFSIFLITALVSLGIALAQWLNLDFDRMYLREIPPNSRPFANTGQPNHLGTLMVWGMIAALAIRAQAKISVATTLLLLAALSFGAALTQSRTALIQFIGCSVLIIFFRRRNILPISSIWAVIAIGMIFIFTLLLPDISIWLGTAVERSVSETGIKTNRTQHWLSMLDAIAVHPWIGWGWQGAAQAQLQGTQFAIKESIYQYTHNIALDIIIWFGLPAGIILLILISHKYFIIFKKTRTPAQAFGFLAFFAFTIHCLLEYPFSYMHLLIPAGIFFGLASNEPTNERNKIPSIFIKPIIFISSCLIIFIVFEYKKIEEYTMGLRFSYANIGQIKLPDSPSVILLTQALSLAKKTNLRPKENINTDEANEYFQAAMRYGTLRLLLHAALAAGFQENPLKSKEFLMNICKIHSPSGCLYAQSMWSEWKESYPFSIGKIDFPVTPHP